MYSLLCLLSLLSLYFFLKLIEGRSRWALAGYIISSALMMYTHVYSFFILAAENIYWLTLLFAARDTFKRMWKRWVLAQIVLVVLFLPWLSVQAQQFSRVQQGFWIPKLPPRLLLYTLTMYAGSNQLAWILSPLIALAIFAGWRGWMGRERAESLVDENKERVRASRLKLYLLLLWLLCPVMLPYIVSQFSSPIFLPKYTIAALPAFLILAARGLSRLRFHTLRALVVVLIVFFSAGVLRNYYAALKKDPWREAVASFERLARPGDLVLFNQASGQHPFDYYLKTKGLDEKPFPDFETELTAENLTALLTDAVKGRGRVWIVVSHPSGLTPLVPRLLAEWYGAGVQITYPGVEMYLFEKRK